MNVRSVDKRAFGLANLPQMRLNAGDLHRVRGFEVDISVLRPPSQYFAFREGITLVGVATKIAYQETPISLQNLQKIGFTDEGVKRDVLREAIENPEYKGIIDRIALRESEARTPDNLICAVLGKVGIESKVLKPFSPRYALGLYKDKPQEFALLFGAFAKFIGRESLEDIFISRLEYVLPLAGQQMSSRSNPMKDLLITAKAESLPGFPFHNVLKAHAAAQLEKKPLSSLENYYMAIWVNNFYKNDAQAQGSFMAKALGFSKLELPEEIKDTALISDPRSHFIAEASEFLFGTDTANQNLFISGGQKTITADLEQKGRKVISDFRATRENYLEDDPYINLGIPVM